jgi:hypothetical protein
MDGLGKELLALRARFTFGWPGVPQVFTVDGIFLALEPAEPA